MKHQHPATPADARPKPEAGPITESPAEQEALQHIGHDGHSSPDTPERHQGETGMNHDSMDHSKMDHSKMDHGGNGS